MGKAFACSGDRSPCGRREGAAGGRARCGRALSDPLRLKGKRGHSEGAVVAQAAPVPGSQAGAHSQASGPAGYSRVDVSLFMPLRWARLDDSTGSSRGAWGVLWRAR